MTNKLPSGFTLQTLCDLPYYSMWFCGLGQQMWGSPVLKLSYMLIRTLFKIQSISFFSEKGKQETPTTYYAVVRAQSHSCKLAISMI